MIAKFPKIALLVALFGAGGLSVRADSGDESVMLWFLQDPVITEVNGGPSVKIGDLVGRGEAEGKTANAVRVSVLSGDSSTPLSVKLSGSDSWLNYIGLPDDEGDNYAGPAYADLAGLNIGGDPEISFVIEIGNASGGDWWTLAVSEVMSLAGLKEMDTIRSTQLSQYGHFYWDGGTYVVPEPTSGMLALFGCGLLALRRKRRKIDSAI